MKTIKNILIAVILICASTMQAQDTYDIFMDKLDLKGQAEQMVDIYLKVLSEKKPSIPPTIWGQVKAKIDYSQWMTETKEIFKYNYTVAEIKDLLAANEMVADANDSGQFLYKPKENMASYLYGVSKRFGRQLNYQISNRLRDLGYSL